VFIFMILETAKELINYFMERPMTREEWYALQEKWKVEMSIAAAAIYIGVSENCIHKLAKSGKIERTRRGHVSTPSVYKYRNELVSNTACCENRIV
jgi:hypothetical protein